MITTVDKEKFESLKELSHIQLQLATGRAELQKLIDTTKEYEHTREKGALEAVKKALEASKGALSEAETNRDTLARFLASVRGLVSDIQKLHEDIQSEFNNFEASTKDVLVEIDSKINESVQTFESIRSERFNLESDIGGFEEQKRQFEKEKVIFNDRRGALERQMQRLKKLKV